METVFLTMGFIGIVFLLLTPWTKTGIIVAIGSLVAYFYFAGVDSWAPIILFVIGLVLIVLEVFIPGFGLLGILGFGSVALGVYYTVDNFGLMLRDLSLALIASIIVVFFLLKSGYSFSNLNQLVLKASSKQTVDIEETEKEIPIRVGMMGTTVTPLRPSGKVVFEGDTLTYDVLSSEGHIAKNTTVVVQEIYGTKIVVREKK